jgi:transposase
MPKSKTRSKPTGLPIIHPYAAGIDIGSRFHVAAVSPDMCDEPVQTFQAFTNDLQRMADWLVATGTKTVVMESTGVYWVAAYEVLESRGLEVVLANAREARAVPGRKSDVNDAQWLQRLHACGLLRASFRPGRDIAELRAYLRAREKHTDYAAAHIQHMQKAMTFMNIQLHHVLATITGVTGMRIIRAIVAGERDPDVLAAMRDVRCKESVETIRDAMVGNYQPEHVFALKQALALYDFYQHCIDECDTEIERTVARLNVAQPVPELPLPKAKHRNKLPSDPNFDVRTAMYQLAGTDLTQIHGIGPFLALRLIGECGTDLSKWRTAKHFTSWLTLAPGCKISGGKVLSAHTRKTSSRAPGMGQFALRLRDPSLQCRQLGAQRNLRIDPVLYLRPLAFVLDRQIRHLLPLLRQRGFELCLGGGQFVGHEVQDCPLQDRRQREWLCYMTLLGGLPFL